MKRITAVGLGVLLAIASMCTAGARQVSDDFLMGPDDVIEVAVPSHSGFANDKDLNKTLIVLPDGKVQYGEMGAFPAAGKTPTMLAADIKKALERTRENVVVVVSVKEVHSRRARILGAVKTNGSYEVKPGWRLLDLVAMAGGLTGKPTRISGHIVRGTTTIVPVELQGAVSQPGGPANVAIEPGDLVLLNEQDVHNQVHVLGQVARPGAYDLQDEGTIVSLISDAGSFTKDAALSKAYVLRGGVRVALNLLPIMRQDKSDESITNFKLLAGDVLFIPEITARFGVMGQVRNPGYFPTSETEEITVMKALSLAGGQSQEGDLRRATIARTVNGKVSATPVNIENLLKRGQQDPNYVLQPNDVLYIPKRGRTFNLGALLSPVQMLYYLGVVR